MCGASSRSSAGLVAPLSQANCPFTEELPKSPTLTAPARTPRSFTWGSAGHTSCIHAAADPAPPGWRVFTGAAVGAVVPMSEHTRRDGSGCRSSDRAAKANAALAQVSLDQTVGSGRSSRTSCAQRQATAILAAHFSASSCEGTSTIANPPRCSGDRPSVTDPSVATTLASWPFTPPPKTHTPASLACSTTSCAAFATSARSSSRKVIAPSLNEIRYRVIPFLLVSAAPAATHLFYGHHCFPELIAAATGYE